jgi:hypothetical protein
MQKLLGNARQYFDVNSIKLIETTPSTGSAQSFEEI